MTILSEKDIQDFADAQPNSSYEVSISSKGEYTPPITDKHIAFLWQYFRDHWRPGERFSFREVSRKTVCTNDGGPLDCTEDGMKVGSKLTWKQVKEIFEVWLAKRQESLTPPEEAL